MRTLIFALGLVSFILYVSTLLAMYNNSYDPNRKRHLLLNIGSVVLNLLFGGILIVLLSIAGLVYSLLKLRNFAVNHIMQDQLSIAVFFFAFSFFINFIIVSWFSPSSCRGDPSGRPGNR